MKVIFLDLDGVLNSEASCRYEVRRKTLYVSNTLSVVACSNLQYILDQNADVKIVISSSWRKLHTMQELKNTLNSYGINPSRVIDKTPSVFSGHRGQEIKMWLEEHPNVTQYVIIDDDESARTALFREEGQLDDERGHFFETTADDGLLFRQARQIALLFRNTSVEDK